MEFHHPFHPKISTMRVGSSHMSNQMSHPLLAIESKLLSKRFFFVFGENKTEIHAEIYCIKTSNKDKRKKLNELQTTNMHETRNKLIYKKCLLTFIQP